MDRTQELSEIVVQALDQAADAVAIFTAHEDLVGSEIVFVNEAFTRMTGYRAEDLVGHSALLLMGQRPALEDVRASLGVRQAGPYFGVTRRMRSDGTTYDVEVRIRGLSDAAGLITHHVLSHREVRSAASESEPWPASSSSSLGLATSGLRAAGTAVDDVVSELREAIVGIALLDEPRCDELTEQLGAALEAADEARDIVAELNSLSGVDTAPRVIDVHEPLELAVRITRGIVGARARLVRSYQELPAVHANPAVLARTFAQLIQNAAAAIPPFLPVANSITVSTYQDLRGDVVVEISDTGIGIPPQSVGRVFDPFFTTRSSAASDGLGLTIARSDILASGGTIGVESVEGRGSRFTVRLPAVAGAIAPRGAMSSSELPRRRVLVACDDQQRARELRAFFEDERTTVVDTEVDEAVERLARAEPYDLVVADAAEVARTALRDRLADVAPEALMRMFEMRAPAPAVRTAARSEVRLSLVSDRGVRHGAQ